MFFNYLLQLSYGAYSPALSQRSVYPLFFRMVPPESTLNLMKIEVLKHFGWKQVATINPPGAKHEAVSLTCVSTVQLQTITKKQFIQSENCIFDNFFRINLILFFHIS